MTKNKETEKSLKEATVKKEPVGEVKPNTFIENVENAIQHIENAGAELSAAILIANAECRGLSRLVGARQNVAQMIKDLKPYLAN